MSSQQTGCERGLEVQVQAMKYLWMHVKILKLGSLIKFYVASSSLCWRFLLFVSWYIGHLTHAEADELGKLCC